MAKMKIVQVLSALRQLFEVLNTFNKKIDWSVSSFDTFLTVAIYIVLFGCYLLIISLIWFCFNQAFALIETSLAMTFLIAFIPCMSSLILMIKTGNFMGETFELLQNTVEQSKCSLFCVLIF